MKKVCLVLLILFIGVSFGYAGTVYSAPENGHGPSKNVFVTNDLLDVFVTNQPIPEPVQFPEIVDYQVVSLYWSTGDYSSFEKWVAAFTQMVLNQIELGWVPVGGIVFYTTGKQITQTMVKYE
jgi:hypothetical protein